MGSGFPSRINKFIRVCSIEIDRYPINPTTLALVDHIRNGGDVPPIKVARKSTGGFAIRDGRHRVTAHKLLGIEYIEARFSQQVMNSSKALCGCLLPGRTGPVFFE